MKILDDLKIAVGFLESYPGSWAICGGIAASIYSDMPRFTGDIDLAMIDLPGNPSKEIAQQICRQLGYPPIAEFVTDQSGKMYPQQALVIGRTEKSGSYVGIDFLLPVLPWIQEAVQRAQTNKLDYGFDYLPTITPEDVIIAKTFAFQGTPGRAIDLDDLRAIARAKLPLDSTYLKARLEKYALQLPDDVQRVFLGT